MKNSIILTIIAEIVSDFYDHVNCPESVGKILRCLSAASFAKESEPLLMIAGALYVRTLLLYSILRSTEEGTRALSINTEALASTR
jgi:hypothetical protein